MSTDPERMVSRALRAQAGAAPLSTRLPSSPMPFPLGWVLLIALLLGAVVGASLALLSLFVPGLLPTLG